MSRYVELWIKEKCSKCEREEKCKPYSPEMAICIMNFINQKKGKEMEKEGKRWKEAITV